MPHAATDWPVEELSVEERLALLGRLWDSLLTDGPPPAPAWHLDEVQRRVALADADPAASIPLDELKRELRGGRA